MTEHATPESPIDAAPFTSTSGITTPDAAAGTAEFATAHHGTAPVATPDAARTLPRGFKALSVPDLVTIGVFTAIYFVLVAVCTFASAIVFAGFGSILLPALCALAAGCVYMLLVARLGRFGGITVMGLVMGLFFLLSGHFILAFLANIVCALAADLIAAAGKYRSKAGILASYVVFSYGLTGPILPLWFMKDAYVAALEAKGKDASYIDGVFAQVNAGSFWLAMAAILVCALIGGWFGQRMCAKHFAKAGII